MDNNPLIDDELLTAEQHWNTTIIFKYYQQSFPDKNPLTQAKLMSIVRKIFLHPENIEWVLNDTPPQIIEQLRKLLTFVRSRESSDIESIKITTDTADRSSIDICNIIDNVCQLTEKSILDIDLESNDIYNDILPVIKADRKSQPQEILIFIDIISKLLSLNNKSTIDDISKKDLLILQEEYIVNLMPSGVDYKLQEIVSILLEYHAAFSIQLFENELDIIREILDDVSNIFEERIINSFDNFVAHIDYLNIKKDINIILRELIKSLKK